MTLRLVMSRGKAGFPLANYFERSDPFAFVLELSAEPFETN
jgi:hypothetical protein